MTKLNIYLMDHLKYFKDSHTIEVSLAEAIEFSKFNKLVSPSKFEIDKLKSINHLSYDFIDDISSFYITMLFKVSDDFVNRLANHISIQIWKYDDEWYYIFINRWYYSKPYTGESGYSNTIIESKGQTIYKCDGFDSVLNIVKNIKDFK